MSATVEHRTDPTEGGTTPPADVADVESAAPDDARVVADTSAGRWWMLSILTTAILLVLLLTEWVRTDDRHDTSNGAGLADATEVNAFLAGVGARGTSTTSIQLPTGVFIQSIEFEGRSDVRLTGYVWHRFPGDVRAAVRSGGVSDRVPVLNAGGETVLMSPGFIFPEQVDSSFTTELRSVIYNEARQPVPTPPPPTASTAPPSATTTLPTPTTAPFTVPPTTVAGGETLPTLLFRSPVADAMRNVQQAPDVADPTAPGSTTVLYYFEAPVRQPFEYVDYPFDHKVVWLRIWPAEFEQNVLLVPDFDGYPCQSQPTKNCTGDRDIFGVDNAIELGEFNREDTYFDYHLDTFYNSNLGNSKFQQSNYPELRFNVVIRRDLANAFVSNLVPLLVAAGLAFGILMTMTRDERRSRRFGFSTTQVMTTLAGLFFAVLIAHQQLRGQFQGVVYLEYFYFVMYLVLLGVGVTAILVSAPATRNRTFFAFGDNLLAQVLYWPTLLLTMLLITFVAL